MAYTSYHPVLQKLEIATVKSNQIFQVTNEQKAVLDLHKSEKYFEDKNITIQTRLEKRLYHWDTHWEGLFETPGVFLFGHQARLDREQYPSAYNYYLDLTYNFGAISLLPILYLIIFTLSRLKRTINAGLMTPSLGMLAAIVLFYLFAENFFKVSFRQPYSGMVMFFLWGRLLTLIYQSEQGMTN